MAEVLSIQEPKFKITKVVLRRSIDYNAQPLPHLLETERHKTFGEMGWCYLEFCAEARVQYLNPELRFQIFESYILRGIESDNVQEIKDATMEVLLDLKKKLDFFGIPTEDYNWTTYETIED